MGHWEHEWERYDPATDKFTYGSSKYVRDKEDEKKDRVKREYDDILSDINNVNDEKGYERVIERIRKSTVLNLGQKDDLRRELVSIMGMINQSNYWRERNEQEDYKRKMAMSEKNSQLKYDAYLSAKSRYKSLSLFGKIKNFKNRPSTISWSTKTVEELDDLYRRR